MRIRRNSVYTPGETHRLKWDGWKARGRNASIGAFVRVNNSLSKKPLTMRNIISACVTSTRLEASPTHGRRIHVTRIGPVYINMQK